MVRIRARPGRSRRPARPVAWANNWKVRSAARRSPPRRPRSASITPTRVRLGKLCPLAAAWVATRMSIPPVSMVSTRARASAALRTVSEEKTEIRASGNNRRASSSSRSTPGPMDTRESAAPQWGQWVGRGMEKPVRWQTRRLV